MFLSGKKRNLTVNDEDEARKHFDWEFKHTRWLLNCLGLWPGKNHFGNLRFFIIVGALILYTIPSIIRTGYMTNDSTINRSHHISIEVAPLLYIIAKLLVFKSKSSMVKIITKQMHEDWDDSSKLSKESKKPIIVYGKRARLINVIFRAFFFTSGIGYSFEPLIKMIINDNLFMKNLPNKGLYPFPTNISPNYEILYILQIIMSALLVFSMLSIDGFLMLSAFHGCAQLSVLSKRISNYDGTTRHIISSKDNSIQLFPCNCSCLKCIVDRHVSLSKYVEIVDDLFSEIIMGRMILNTIHFCGVGYIIVQSKEDRNFANLLINALYMITMTSNLFLYCWIGEHLATEGDNIGQTIYEIDWYNRRPENVKLLILPILRCKKTLKITAGKFFIMSYACYKEWFVKAVGFLSVLLAVKSQN